MSKSNKRNVIPIATKIYPFEYEKLQSIANSKGLSVYKILQDIIFKYLKGIGKQ